MGQGWGVVMAKGCEVYLLGNEKILKLIFIMMDA